MRGRRRAKSRAKHKGEIDSKSPSASLDGQILDGTESDLASFGETGVAGFADAWSESDVEANTEKDFAFGADDADLRSRNLDRRSRRGLTALVLLLAIGGGTFWAYSQGFFDNGGTDETNPSQTERLVSPSEVRVYTDGASTVRGVLVGSVEDQFRASSRTDAPEPLGTTDGRSIRFGGVLWGGRNHVAVGSSEPFDLDVDCVVVTLATADLRVLDLASVGSCGDVYAETGNRTACVANRVVLLEVWANDPDSTEPKAPVEIVRVRVERVDTDGSIDSTRGTLSVPSADGADPLAESSVLLSGDPGADVVINLERTRGECELLDRSEVPVQLLPG